MTQTPFGSFVVREIKILSGQTGSDKIALDGMTLVGILFPAMTGTQVHIHASDAIDGTFVNAFQSLGATQLTYTVGAAGRFNSVNPNAESMGIKYLQLVAASSQAADRTIKLFLKGI